MKTRPKHSAHVQLLTIDDIARKRHVDPDAIRILDDVTHHIASATLKRSSETADHTSLLTRRRKKSATCCQPDRK